MNLTTILTQAIILVIGGGITVLIAHFLIKEDIKNYLRLKSLEANKVEKSDKQGLLSLRLQAHERLIVFIERINPVNLLVRLHQQGISIGALQAVILNEINAEYQHNITQQLYVDSVSWDVIRKLKEDTIAMINSGVQGLPEDANGIELSKKVLQHMSGIAENPYDLTINLLKKDIHKLF